MDRKNEDVTLTRYYGKTLSIDVEAFPILHYYIEYPEEASGHVKYLVESSYSKPGRLYQEPLAGCEPHLNIPSNRAFIRQIHSLPGNR